MGVEVEDRDIGFTKLQKELAWLQGKSVTIGWQGASALETGETEATIVDIATFQEFGTVTIPERPALRSVFDEKAAELEAFIEKELGAVLELKRTGEQALNRIGLKAVSLLQDKIRSSPSWAEALKQATIEKKGSSVPLIDTGRLLASVTYAIRDGDNIIQEGKAA